MSRLRSSSLGCLGCFSILVMGFGTALLVPALLWLNPYWLDRIAVWRPAPYPPDDLGTEAVVDAPPVPKRVEEYRLIQAAAASVDYDPARGARLDAPDGARVELPGRAIREPLRVTLTPVAHLPKAMQGAVCGPAYELRIGANEHYRFGAPVRVTLPYLPELQVNGTQPAVCVWESDRWVPMRTTADPTARQVTADLPHASPVGVFSAPLPPVVYIPAVVTAAAAGIGYVYSSTERGALWASTTFRSSKKMVTNSFAIHYFTEGEHAVTADAAYPLAAGRPPGAHPLYVLDVAQMLEDARANLSEIGMQVAVPKLIRHDVFLHHDKAFGSSPPGGPIFIHPRLNELAAADMEAGTLIRGTIVHELIHVAQDAFFGGIPQRFRDRWWIEATAQYLSERWWAARGVKIDLAETFYLKGEPRLCEKPMDTTSDPEYYAWAVFLHWLDRRAAGSGFAFVRAVNEAKAADLATLDAAGKKALGEPLADVFEKFARDFYHGDVWSGAIMPILHRDTARNQALAQHCRDRDRTFVLTRVGAEENDWAIAHTPPVKPLTAHAMITQVEGLSPHLKGKLVVTVSGTTNPDLAVHLAKDSVSPKLPSSGAPGEFEAFSPAAGGKASRVIEGVGSSKGINRVTVLFVNKSLARDAGTFGVERWLLVPPDTVTSERERPGQTQWKVRWDRVGLQSCPQAFKGYNVYRRKAGEPDSAYRLVREDVTEAWCLDTAPDAEDYAYTVKVKDVLGNLSEPAPNDLGDPFQGDWEGEVALVNGEFARPIVSALRDKQAEQEKKALAALAREKDPARRTSGQQDLARERESMTQFIAMVEKFLTMAEDLARLGIPAVLRIQRVDGQYQLSIPEVMWQATDAKEGAKMKRVGPHTLAFVEQPKDFPPLYLRLHRKDEIREREWKVRHMEDGKTYEFSFRWSFKRKE